MCRLVPGVGGCVTGDPVGQTAHQTVCCTPCPSSKPGKSEKCQGQSRAPLLSSDPDTIHVQCYVTDPWANGNHLPHRFLPPRRGAAGWGLTSHHQLNRIAPLHRPCPDSVLCLAVVCPRVGRPQAVPRQLGLAAQRQGCPPRHCPEPAVADGWGPAGHAGQAGPGSRWHRQPQRAGPDGRLGRWHWKTKQTGPGLCLPWR